MEYRGAYPLFNLSRVRTYPLAGRKNKVEISDFADPAALRCAPRRRPPRPDRGSGTDGEKRATSPRD